MRLVHAKQNEQRSLIKFMTSAEAIRVSDSESSSNENVRKRAIHANNSDTDDDLDSRSDEENVDVDEETDANDELVFPIEEKNGGSILVRNMRTRSTCYILRSAIAQLTTDTKIGRGFYRFGRSVAIRNKKIPSKISSFVVNSFEHEKMKLETETDNISVSEEDVRQLLGLPLGVEYSMLKTDALLAIL